MKDRVLESRLAGGWYTDDAERLAHEIDNYLAAAKPVGIEHPIALILPHAGYRYSGATAAQGVRQVAGQTFSRVVVMGPSHRVALSNAVSIPDADAVETPLGRIPIDRGLVSKLRKNPAFQSHPAAHAEEHSVQIELPLLQRALGDFKLVPIVCGQVDEAAARNIAHTLLENIDDDTLVVVSSDFTHYGHAFGYLPFDTNIRRNLEKLDLGAYRFIEQRDLPGFLDYIDTTGATICGRAPLAILLAMLPDDAHTRLLEYTTSGAVTGDWSHCVSYLAAAVSGHWKKTERPALSASDKLALLRLARNRIAARLGVEPLADIQPTPAMKAVMGAFVTLHKHGELRGCIGEIIPRRPLVEAVAEQAVNAAFHDPRFPPLQTGELDEIDIEISALTPPHPVDSYNDIVIGRHGIVLEKNGRSAVFLPQVAPEQGWSLEETLAYLALKAGLRPDDWRSGCRFEVFEAIVFGEK